MKRCTSYLALALCMVLCLTACGRGASEKEEASGNIPSPPQSTSEAGVPDDEIPTPDPASEPTSEAGVPDEGTPAPDPAAEPTSEAGVPDEETPAPEPAAGPASGSAGLEGTWTFDYSNSSDITLTLDRDGNGTLEIVTYRDGGQETETQAVALQLVTLDELFEGAAVGATETDVYGMLDTTGNSLFIMSSRISIWVTRVGAARRIPDPALLGAWEDPEYSRVMTFTADEIITTQGGNEIDRAPYIVVPGNGEVGNMAMSFFGGYDLDVWLYRIVQEDGREVQYILTDTWNGEPDIILYRIG